jgi:hypothetical protein
MYFRSQMPAPFAVCGCYAIVIQTTDDVQAVRLWKLGAKSKRGLKILCAIGGKEYDTV